MHLDLDELVTSTDAGVHEQQWRGGSSRQLQPGALAHQVAASQAAAEKRKAAAMPQEERDAKRNAAKRAKRAAGAHEEAERKAAVADVVADLVDQVVEQWMLDERPGLDDLNTWLEEDGDSEVDDAEYRSTTLSSSGWTRSMTNSSRKTTSPTPSSSCLLIGGARACTSSGKPILRRTTGTDGMVSRWFRTTRQLWTICTPAPPPRRLMTTTIHTMMIHTMTTATRTLIRCGISGIVRSVHCAVCVRCLSCPAAS